MKYYVLLDSETKKMVKYFRCADDLRSGHAILTEDRNNWLNVPAPMDLLSARVKALNMYG